MRIALAALVALAIGGSAFGQAASKHDAMACDHPEAKAASAPAKADWRGVIVRGEKIQKPANVVLAELIRAPERHDGKAVVVEGKVRRACERMGCWMELADGKEDRGVRITFKDYGFFVPTNSAGAKAKVAGTVKLVELSEATASHYESEGGGVSKDSPGRLREVQLVATGVELSR